MAKLNVYVITDALTGVANTPFFMANEEVAKRTVASAVNDPTTDLYKNPDSYALFFIGSFDNEEGIIVSEEVPKFVCKCSDLYVSDQWDSENVDRLLTNLKNEYMQQNLALVEQVNQLSKEHKQLKKALSKSVLLKKALRGLFR